MEEAYYHYYGLKTPEEDNHPFTAVLALKSEDHHTYSLLRSRIDRYFDLDIGAHGISLSELLELPRYVVDEIFRKATDIKAKKAKTNGAIVDNLEAELNRLR